MAQPASNAATVMGLLGRGRSGDARRELAALVKSQPRDSATWVCAAWVEHDARNFVAMRAATERAAKLGAPGFILDILRATAASALGEMDLAISCAQRASRTSKPPHKLLADTILGEALFFADRVEELSAHLATNQEFRDDPQGQLLLSRVHRKQDRPADSEAVLRTVFSSNASMRVRRFAGSELAKLLDSMRRFDEAFAAAKATHAATGTPYDTGRLVGEVEATAALAARGAFKGMARADGPIPPTALICALPRSGTTLVEQMLDRHPSICGIGESHAIHAMAAGFNALGGWPAGVLCAMPADLQRLRDGYLSQTRGARGLPPSVMTLDKSVQTWRRLPAVAAGLPGAKLVRLKRDARDTAISLFLSPMDPRSMGWTCSIADIKRVIEAERRCLPSIIAALQLEVIDVRYEELVRDPRSHLERTLAFLGLPWHEECLAPEGNSRVVFTLSQEQVRRPINAEGIDRWKNYAAHFDASWEKLNA